MYRYENITYEKMQKTLRYMTKLDRAIQNEKELDNLSGYYKSLNITSTDLFDVLKKVHRLVLELGTIVYNWIFSARNSPHRRAETWLWTAFGLVFHPLASNTFLFSPQTMEFAALLTEQNTKMQSLTSNQSRSAIYCCYWNDKRTLIIPISLQWKQKAPCRWERVPDGTRLGTGCRHRRL